jgi:hypothetical protein
MASFHFNTALEPQDLRQILGMTDFACSLRSYGKTMEDLTDRCNSLVTPFLSYRIKTIESADRRSVTLGGGIVFNSSKLAKVVRRCEHIVCFVATIGPGLEDEVGQLTRQNRLRAAYILDSMGSKIIENMVESFHQDMEERMSKSSKGVTLRFSPGYCDWPITEQRAVFKILGATGILLSDSCLMHPRKSISGVFGISPVSLGCPDYLFNPCTECGKKNCTARRS